jgi:hypothetical protein
LYLGEEASGSPTYYTFNGLDSGQDTQILLNPKPNAVETLRFDVVKRQPDLTSNDDVLLVPAKPVIHLAVAYLSDAIAIDAAKHPEELIYRTV